MKYLTAIAQTIDPNYKELIEENNQLHSDIDGYLNTMTKLQNENKELKEKLNKIRDIVGGQLIISKTGKITK